MIPQSVLLNDYQYDDLKKQKEFLRARIPLLDKYEKKRFELKLLVIQRRIEAYERLHKSFYL